MLCDPNHSFETYGTNGLTLLADSGLSVLYKGVGTPLEALHARIRKELQLP